MQSLKVDFYIIRFNFHCAYTAIYFVSFSASFINILPNWERSFMQAGATLSLIELCKQLGGQSERKFPQFVIIPQPYDILACHMLFINVH